MDGDCFSLNTEPKLDISMITVRWVHSICLMQELNHNKLLEIKSMNKIKDFHTFLSLNFLYKNILGLEDDMLSDDANKLFKSFESIHWNGHVIHRNESNLSSLTEFFLLL